MLASSTSPAGVDSKCQPKGDWAMLLTRKAWYGLTAVKHLAEQPRDSWFSAKDLSGPLWISPGSAGQDP